MRDGAERFMIRREENEDEKDVKYCNCSLGHCRKVLRQTIRQGKAGKEGVGIEWGYGFKRPENAYNNAI